MIELKPKIVELTKLIFKLFNVTFIFIATIFAGIGSWVWLNNSSDSLYQIVIILLLWLILIKLYQS